MPAMSVNVAVLNRGHGCPHVAWIASRRLGQALFCCLRQGLRCLSCPQPRSIDRSPNLDVMNRRVAIAAAYYATAESNVGCPVE